MLNRLVTGPVATVPAELAGEEFDHASIVFTTPEI